MLHNDRNFKWKVKESRVSDECGKALAHIKKAQIDNFETDTLEVADDLDQAKKSVETAKILSEKTIKSDIWEDLLIDLEAEGYLFDEHYYDEPVQWIHANKDGNSYEIEVTEYSDGVYEINTDNISQLKKEESLEDVCKELNAFLDSKRPSSGRCYCTNNEIINDIEWGDWKHDHLFFTWNVMKFFQGKDMGYHISRVITDEDSSDSYSAEYTITL